VNYLNNGQELLIAYNIKIRSLKIDDREVLRIFDIDDDKKITLFTFFNDNPVIKSVHEE
jgi:hypothetical protein